MSLPHFEASFGGFAPDSPVPAAMVIDEVSRLRQELDDVYGMLQVCQAPPCHPYLLPCFLSAVFPPKEYDPSSLPLLTASPFPFPVLNAKQSKEETLEMSANIGKKLLESNGELQEQVAKISAEYPAEIEVPSRLSLFFLSSSSAWHLSLDAVVTWVLRSLLCARWPS